MTMSSLAIALTQEERIARLQVGVTRVGGKAALGRALGYKDGAFVGQMLRGERPITEKTMQAASAVRALQDLFSWTPSDAGAAPAKTHAVAIALEDWRLQASSRSQQVIDNLILLAKKNQLRDEDWQLIEELAARFRQK